MRRYDGKNAIWFIILCIGFNLLPLFILFVSINVLTIIILLFYYSFDLIMIPIIFRNHIDLYDDYFLFYYGFTKTKVNLSDIRMIEKTKSMMSASANSLDRIYIDTKDKDFMISLKNNDNFIEEVSKRKNAI